MNSEFIIKSNKADHYKLQQDLGRFPYKCVRNKLELDKSKNTHTQKKKHLQIHLQFIWNKPWKSTIDQRLGSQFADSKLHLDIHVDTIINRAFRMYEFVFRSWTNCTQSPTYLNLFDFLVRSLLEYSVSIWTPLYDKYIKDLESVQKIRTPDSI